MKLVMSVTISGQLSNLSFLTSLPPTYLIYMGDSSCEVYMLGHMLVSSNILMQIMASTVLYTQLHMELKIF